MDRPLTSIDVDNWLVGLGGDKVAQIEADLRQPNSEVQEYLDWMSGQHQSVTPLLVINSLGSENSTRRRLALKSAQRPLGIKARLAVNVRSVTNFAGLSILAHRNKFITASFIIFSISLLLLFNSSQKTIVANDIAEIETAYPVVDTIAPILPTADLLAPSTVSIISSHLQTIFNSVIQIKSTGPTISLAKGKAYLGSARLKTAQPGQLGVQDALTDLLNAKQYFEQLSPSDVRDISLADVALNQSRILGYQGDYQSCINITSDAIPTVDRLVRRSPNNAEAQFRLALLINNRANSLRGLALPLLTTNAKEGYSLLDRAEQDYKRAISVGERVVQSKKFNASFEEWLSRLNGNLGLLLINQSSQRPEAAVEAIRRMEQAVNIADDLALRYPASLTIEDAQVAATLNLGDVRFSTADFSGAKAAFEAAVNFYDKLEVKSPGAREFVWGQASARRSLGHALVALGDKAAAGPILNRSLEIYDKLVIKHSNVAEIVNERNDLINLMNSLK